MRQKIETGTFVLAVAMLLAVGLPATAQEIRDVATDSPLIDLLMSDGMTREEMVGLYEAVAIGDFEPPDCVPGEEMFDDVPASDQFCSWIEELARRGITSGCDATNYCPGNPVDRAQMAVFLVRATAGVALGHARVTISGIVEGGAGRNVTSDNITRASTGLYCFHDLPFAPTLVLATPFGLQSDEFATAAHYDFGGGSGCPPNTQFKVFMRRTADSTLANEAFAVVFR